MKWITEYLRCIYKDGGRGPNFYDCWGLVREARNKYLGLQLLSSYGDLRNNNPRAFTKAYRNQSALMEKCEPEHGAVAAVMSGDICIHVALVIKNADELFILEINPIRSVRFMPLTDWEREHFLVTYHRDKI